MVAGGYGVTVYCACGHRARLDLPGLASRLGDDHGALAPDLLPRLRCRRCNARPEQMIVSPGSPGGSYFKGAVATA